MKALVVTSAGNPIMAGRDEEKVWATVGKLLVSRLNGNELIEVHPVDWID